MRGTDLDFAFATCLIKARVSSDRRPAARTARRARPRLPESSGYVRCFSRRNFKERKLSGLQGRLDWVESSHRSHTLLHDSIYKQLQAKVYVFAESVSCLGGKCQLRPTWILSRVLNWWHRSWHATLENSERLVGCLFGAWVDPELLAVSRSLYLETHSKTLEP